MLPETKTLLSRWQSLSQGKLPRREQFNPFKIPNLLPDMFVLDVRGRVEDYTFRLVGTALTTAYGLDMTGKRLEEIKLGQVNDTILKDYEVCAHQKVAALSRQTFKVRTLGPFLHERLLLPFETDKPGEVGQIIGGFFFETAYKGLNWKNQITDWAEEERFRYDLSAADAARAPNLAVHITVGANIDTVPASIASPPAI